MSVDFLKVAARVSVPEICPVCKNVMIYDDGRDAYICECGFSGVNGPVEKIGFEQIAASMSDEASCHIHLEFSTVFKGSIKEKTLAKKLKSEIMAAIKSVISITANELQLEVSKTVVKPPGIDLEFSNRNEP